MNMKLAIDGDGTRTFSQSIIIRKKYYYSIFVKISITEMIAQSTLPYARVHCVERNIYYY